MKKVSLTFALTVFLMQPMFVSAEETCVEITAPVTSVADFNADGIVNRRDMRMLTKYIQHARLHRRLEKLQSKGSGRVNSRYFRKHLDHNVAFNPMFDRNADGEINQRDVMLVARDMRKHSTEEDQKLATINNAILDGTYTCEAVQEEPVIAPTSPAGLGLSTGPAPSV